MKHVFPSPHSGILFLFLAGFKKAHVEDDMVSVPSFGDSFFISSVLGKLVAGLKFPSPHSGILFLLYDV